MKCSVCSKDCSKHYWKIGSYIPNVKGIICPECHEQYEELEIKLNIAEKNYKEQQDFRDNFLLRKFQ